METKKIRRARLTEGFKESLKNGDIDLDELINTLDTKINEIDKKNTKVTEMIKKNDFFKNKEFILTPLKRGPICRTFCMITDDNKKYLVRINDIYSPCSVDREVSAVKFLKEISDYDWIPNLLYYSENRAVSVTEFHDNCENISNFKKTPENILSISNQLLKIIQEMHNIKVNTLESYNVFLFNELDETTKRAYEKKVITKEELETILNYYNEILYFKTLQPVFIHTDISPDNLIYNRENNKLHLIDFEFCRIGDPYYDYAHIYKTFLKESCIEYLIAFEEFFKGFLDSNIYKIYSLYFDISWYLIDVEFYNEENITIENPKIENIKKQIAHLLLQ